jgi:predicted phage-related endonuclease
MNEAMRFGKVFEENARAHVSIEHGCDYEATNAEHEDFPFLRASLDGWNGKEFVEIKYIGKEKLEKATEGLLPEHYFIQMQHQFLVTGSERAWYVCYTLTKDRKQMDQVKVIEVLPDLDFIKNVLFPREMEFWKLVIEIREMKQNQIKCKKPGYVKAWTS